MLSGLLIATSACLQPVPGPMRTRLARPLPQSAVPVTVDSVVVEGNAARRQRRRHRRGLFDRRRQGAGHRRAQSGQLPAGRRRQGRTGALHAGPSPARSGAESGGSEPAARLRAGGERESHRAAHGRPRRARRRHARAARHRAHHGGRARRGRRRQPGRGRECEGPAAVRHHSRPDLRTNRRAHGARGQPRARQRSDAARRHQPGVADLRVVRHPGGAASGPAPLYGGEAAPGRSARPANETAPPAAGQITFVDNTVDQTTGTIRIKATFPNTDRRLWPGQFVNVVRAARIRSRTRSSCHRSRCRPGRRGSMSSSSSPIRPSRCGR